MPVADIESRECPVAIQRVNVHGVAGYPDLAAGRDWPPQHCAGLQIERTHVRLRLGHRDKYAPDGRNGKRHWTGKMGCPPLGQGALHPVVRLSIVMAWVDGPVVCHAPGIVGKLTEGAGVRVS